MPHKSVGFLGATQMPKKIVESVSNSVIGFIEDCLIKDQAELARERLETLPLHEVEVGRKALDASGRALDDSIALSAAAGLLRSKREADLSVQKRTEAEIFRNIGYGTMKRAVLRATSKEEYAQHVPEDVVKEAVQRSINLGADPERSGFIKPEESEQVSEVFDKFDNITVFTGSK